MKSGVRRIWACTQWEDNAGDVQCRWFFFLWKLGAWIYGVLITTGAKSGFVQFGAFGRTLGWWLWVQYPRSVGYVCVLLPWCANSSLLPLRTISRQISNHSKDQMAQPLQRALADCLVMRDTRWSPALDTCLTRYPLGKSHHGKFLQCQLCWQHSRDGKLSAQISPAAWMSCVRVAVCLFSIASWPRKAFYNPTDLNLLFKLWASAPESCAEARSCPVASWGDETGWGAFSRSDFHCRTWPV